MSSFLHHYLDHEQSELIGAMHLLYKGHKQQQQKFAVRQRQINFQFSFRPVKKILWPDEKEKQIENKKK